MATWEYHVEQMNISERWSAEEDDGTGDEFGPTQ